MLRLTTKVTVSPASSARSSSAAGAHPLDRAPRRWTRTSPSAPRSTAPRPRGRAPVAGPTRSDWIANGASVRPEPRRGMKDQYLVLTTSSTCCSTHSGSRYCAVDAEPLGQRDAVLRQALAHLVRRRERVLGRDVVAVGAQARRGRSRPRRPAPASARDRFGGTWMPTPGSSSRATPISSTRSSSETGDAQSGTPAIGTSRRPVRQKRSRAPRSRCRPAPRRSTSGAGRSSGG